MEFKIIGISTGYSGNGRGAQNALNGLDELTPLTPPNVVIGRFGHHRLWKIRFLDRQSVPQIPKRRPIAWRMHSRNTMRRTLNTVQRTPPKTHNKILFVLVINQAGNKLAEKVKFFLLISCRFECRTWCWLCQGCRDVPEIGKVPQNSRRYKDDERQTPYLRPTNIRRYCTKFSRHGDLAPRICAPLDYATRPFMSFLSLYTKARDRNLKQATTSFFQILINSSSSIRHSLDDTYYELLPDKMSVKQTNKQKTNKQTNKKQTKKTNKQRPSENNLNWHLLLSLQDARALRTLSYVAARKWTSTVYKVLHDIQLPARVLEGNLLEGNVICTEWIRYDKASAAL
jgi:hypothetical protein